MATQFGEMLMNRRRQMGLSIQQVANIIKIRPQIIEYFETGDFASMPLRGYATGMITSYARFLNLNPREVMNAYFRELEAFEHNTSHSGGRLSGPAGDVTTRSAAETGRFMMVNTPPRSRYAQRPPQAGYVSESVSPHLSGADDGAPGYGRRGASGGYRGPSARPGSPRGRARRDPATAGRGGADRRDLARSRTRGSAPRPSGRPAYGQRGPSGSRAGSGSQRRRRGSAAPSLGIDPRIIVGGLVLLGIIIVLLAMLLVRGCSPSAPAAGSSSETTAAVSDSGSSSKEESDDEGSGASDGSEAEDGSSADASATEGADGTQATEQTVVKITVAKGETSWLEVRLDGQTVYGNEVVGPFEQEYTVTDSIRITSNTPSSVNVTLNGETVRWDTSTSGVARISITAPEPASEDGADSSAAADGADAASADGASSDGQSQGASSASAGGTE